MSRTSLGCSACSGILLGPRLRGCDPAADPLRLLRQGMERLAVRDADRLLAELLQQLAAEP